MPMRGYPQLAGAGAPLNESSGPDAPGFGAPGTEPREGRGCLHAEPGRPDEQWSPGSHFNTKWGASALFDAHCLQVLVAVAGAARFEHGDAPSVCVPRIWHRHVAELVERGWVDLRATPDADHRAWMTVALTDAGLGVLFRHARRHEARYDVELLQRDVGTSPTVSGPEAKADGPGAPFGEGGSAPSPSTARVLGALYVMLLRLRPW